MFIIIMNLRYFLYNYFSLINHHWNVMCVCGSMLKLEFMYPMQSDDLIQVQYVVIQSCRHATIAMASGRKGPPQQREIPVAGMT